MNKKWMVALMLGASAVVAWAQNALPNTLAKPETSGSSSPLIPPLISDSSDGEPAKSFVGSPLDECKPFSKYIYTKYGTAIDPRTGLEWTRCMLGQTWNGTSCTGNAITENIGKNKEQMASALKEMQFAGSTDWRTPTREEVQIAFQRIEAKSCIDYTRLGGIPYVSKFVPPFLFTMDTAGIKHPRFFLETYRNNGMAHDDLDSVGFGDEASLGKNGYRIKRHLICEGNYCSNKQGYDLSGAGWIFVRFASKSVPLPQAGAQEFIDPATSLKWLRCPVGAKVVVENGEEKCVGQLTQVYSLDEALERIRKDYPDWRLPTPLEIQYLISRVGGLKTAPGFHGSHTQKTCSDVAAGNALLFPGGTHTADSFVYTAETSSEHVGKFWTTNMLLSNRLCGVDVQTYGTAKVPLFLVKGYDSSGEWEKLLGLKLNSFKIQTSARQAIQRDNLAFESSWLGGVVKSFATAMNSSATTKSSDSGSTENNWRIERTKKVSAVSWSAETYVKCTGSRNRGESFKILHLDNGRYQSVTGPIETTLKKVADFHCN